MRLAPGHTLGPYEIDSPIGAGGMGEVYRARDTRLDRSVAIKILPAHLSEHADRKARFEREAKAISSLSHPHICTLHDIGHDDGIDYMVMEYLEGETLADRIGEGPMAMDEVLALGAQIAGALHAAHRQGVLHRDLKPGNIILTVNGVKVLDFGLAKLGAGESSSIHATHTAEMSRDPITEEGTVLGTPRYMSPEMLEGREADIRSDVFALGAVLYEMATGKPAFEGDTRASIVGAIMKEEPAPVSDHVPLTPESFDRLVRQCLAKDPETRVQSAHDVRLALGWSGEETAGGPAPEQTARRSRSWWIPLGVGLLAFIFGIWWGRSGEETPGPQPPMHVSVPLDEGTQLTGWGSPLVAISPDGSRLAWVAAAEGGEQYCYVSDLHSGTVTRIPDSEEAEGPFFSPDGNWVGFAVSTSAISGREPELRKYSMERGITQTLCKITDFFGGNWLEDGTIIFSGMQPGGLRAVSASGGVATPLDLKDPAGATITPTLVFPDVLPGGNIVATAWGPGKDGVQAMLIDGKTLVMKPLGIPSTFARYSRTGHLLYCTPDATLFAVPFDPSTGTVTGSAIGVLDDIALSGNGAGVMALAGNGTLAHITGYVRGSRRELSEIIRVTRTGVQETLPFPPDIYERNPQVSDDGKRLVVALWDERLQVLDLTRNTSFSVLAPENGASSPVWVPGGKEVIFTSYRAGKAQVGIYRTGADGLGNLELIHKTADEVHPGNLTPRADTLICLAHQEDGGSILALELETGTAKELFRESTLLHPRLSRNGRMLAYTSGETGPNEVYVRTFPDCRNRTPVSVGGGLSPRWSADGTELFYRSGDRVYAVSVAPGTELSFGPPHVMFEMDGIQGYDVAPDGSFYVVRTLPGAGIHTEIQLITGWTDELRELMSTQ